MALFRGEDGTMRDTTVRLLAVAGVLMLLAGGIFAFLRLWIYAALLLAGAFGCLAGALGFRKWDGKEESADGESL